MTWAEVAGRLESARTYWLDTTMPSGAPHAAPVWGAVVDDTLHLYTERGTVKARNIAVSPRVLAVAWQLADYTGSQRRWARLVQACLSSGSQCLAASGREH
jgi:hypothetical protein